MELCKSLSASPRLPTVAGIEPESLPTAIIEATDFPPSHSPCTAIALLTLKLVTVLGFLNNLLQRTQESTYSIEGAKKIYTQSKKGKKKLF